MSKSVVETTFHVRYAETDQMGIVHHSAYVVWLEEGRSQWLRHHGKSYVEFEAEGLVLAVSELHVRYKQSARYDQRVTIRCWVDEVRSRQVQFSYDIIAAGDGTLFATATSKHICLNRQGCVTTLPEAWQSVLRQES